MIRLPLALALALLAASCGGSPPVSATSAPPPAPSNDAPTAEDVAFLRAFEESLHAARGESRPRLVRSAALDAAARFHARDMATRDYMAHRSPEGSTPEQRVWQLAPRAIISEITENIHRERTNQPLDPTQRGRDAHQGLMNSPRHRENILATGHTHVGIGVARATRDGLVHEYAVQVFGRVLGEWEVAPPPTLATPVHLRLELTARNVEFYLQDLDKPRAEYPSPKNPNLLTIGGLLPELQINPDPALAIPALEPGRYRLLARFAGEDLYAACAPDWIVAPR